MVLNMALIRCPECNHEISETAESCPNCGYKLAEKREEQKETPFEPVISPLSKKKASGLSNAILGMIGGCILIAAGIPLVTIGVGVILIILGIVAFFGSMNDYKKHQYGKCPYCGTELKVVAGNTSFKCPVCNNVGTQTETTIESTH